MLIRGYYMEETIQTSYAESDFLISVSIISLKFSLHYDVVTGVLRQ
jgi:hypothetical protein